MHVADAVIDETAAMAECTYLDFLLQHSGPFHDEIPTLTGRPDVLTGPDVAKDV